MLHFWLSKTDKWIWRLTAIIWTFVWLSLPLEKFALVLNHFNFQIVFLKLAHLAIIHIDIFYLGLDYALYILLICSQPIWQLSGLQQPHLAHAFVLAQILDIFVLMNPKWSQKWVDFFLCNWFLDHGRRPLRKVEQTLQLHLIHLWTIGHKTTIHKTFLLLRLRALPPLVAPQNTALSSPLCSKTVQALVRKQDVIIVFPTISHGSGMSSCKITLTSAAVLDGNWVPCNYSVLFLYGIYQYAIPSYFILLGGAVVHRLDSVAVPGRMEERRIFRLVGGGWHLWPQEVIL